MPSYTTEQIVYTFTFSAGSASGIDFDNGSGDGMAAMQKYVQQVATDVLANSTVQGLIGSDWQIVWGPVAYASDTTGPTVHADNTMGCYYSPSQDLYVVAVAGTNFESTFDWTDEDLDVRTQVPWTSLGGTGAGSVSAGTANGLTTLLAMTDGGGSTMLSALALAMGDNGSSGSTLAVTGHSLGGALSPVLALYLAQQTSVDLFGASIAVQASAGPTPGDADFASMYEAAIADGTIASYSSVYNTLDVVPLAWAVSDLATVPTLYDAHIKPASSDSPPDAFLGSVVAGAVMALAQAGVAYTQVSTNRTSLAGTFGVLVDAGASVLMDSLQSSLPSALATYFESITNVVRFAAQAVYQHIDQYPSLVGISAFETQFTKIVAADKPASATHTDPVRAAVLRLSGLDLAEAQRAAAARTQAA